MVGYLIILMRAGISRYANEAQSVSLSDGRGLCPHVGAAAGAQGECSRLVIQFIITLLGWGERVNGPLWLLSREDPRIGGACDSS